jgi:hypothetical protein
VALLFVVGACRSPSEPAPIVGTFLATTFTMAPSGLGTQNVLALGGTLGINVANNLVTAGTLVLPPSVTGTTTFTASMAGVADTTGATVRFVPAGGSFVGNLTFTLVENRLEARNQTVSGTQYDLILTRQ